MTRRAAVDHEMVLPAMAPGDGADVRHARESVVDEEALAIGRWWVARWCADLEREGRTPDGGWPGTLPEARAYVAARLGDALVRRRMTALTEGELGAAAKRTYECARGDWLAARKRTRSPRSR